MMAAWSRIVGALVAGLVLMTIAPSPLRAERVIDRSLWDAAAVRAATPVDVPPITLLDVGGRRVSLGDFRRRVLMLYFWATW
jgi:hypothetical protein